MKVLSMATLRETVFLLPTYLSIPQLFSSISMDFVSIDVETANEDIASICQIGIVVYKDSELVKTYCTYVDPKNGFSPFNIWIHSIDETTVEGPPTFNELIQDLYDYLNGKIAVCHTHFVCMIMVSADTLVDTINFVFVKESF